MPTVRKHLGRAISLLAGMEEHASQIEELGRRADLNSGSAEGTEYVHRLLLLQREVASIEKTGCQVKSVEQGLIDFPCLKEGREVYLCWKYGEDDIGFWHEVDAGFAGRIPITEEN